MIIPIRIGVAIASALVLLALTAATASGLGVGGLKANYGADQGPADLSGDGNALSLLSVSTNLTPEALTAAFGYVRNLDSGLVSAVGGQEHSLSDDGRFVAYSWLGQQANVYVRDRQQGTTVLASRATGPNGAPADQQYGFMRPSISSNGRFVAFQSTPALDPADTDSIPDIYVRDLLNDSTTLVSRASGVSGVKGDHWSEGPSISGDGRYVAFESRASNLSVDDTYNMRDIYVRDLVAHTTTLATRAWFTGNSGDSFHPDITPDGRFVAFDSRSTQLAPGDDDAGSADIYVRDLQSGTTVLASPGTGTQPAEHPALAADGNRVAFDTLAALVPEDVDGPEPQFRYDDVYLRDIQAGTTALVSRASGAAGADASGYWPAMSDDGRYISFSSFARNLAPDDNDDRTDVYVRDTQEHVTSLESRATPGYMRYVRPQSATPIRVSLVQAYQPCTAPNRTHGPALAFDACHPPRPESPNLVTSQGEARPNSVGSLRLGVLVGDPFTAADEADVRIRLRLTHVMNAADASDYLGELRGAVEMRITDRLHGPSATEEGTVSDIPFGFVVPCVATDSTSLGSDCALTTTAEAIVPGFATERSRAVHGLGQLRVFDGGPDGDADTPAGDSLFAVQGIFVP
jgi:Tol biopolymer transport system component